MIKGKKAQEGFGALPLIAKIIILLVLAVAILAFLGVVASYLKGLNLF